MHAGRRRRKSPNPKPTECVKAIDHTFRGPVDISHLVKVGNPVQKSEYIWRVPYNAMDKAGNEAATAWREVIIEEVELCDLETRLRQEIMAEKASDIEIAVNRAVEAEKKKMAQSGSEYFKTSDSCPACPSCECKGAANGESFCTAICNSTVETLGQACDKKERFVGFLDFADFVLTPSLWGAFGVLVTIFAFLFGLRFIFTFIFNPNALWRGGDIYHDSREAQLPSSTAAGLLSPAVPYLDNRLPGSAGPHPIQQRRDTGGGLFSPPQNRMSRGQQAQESVFSSRANGASYPPQRYNTFDDSIYQDNLIITPRKTGI